MTHFLLELENFRCKEYLYNNLSSLGNLIHKVVTGAHLSGGTFYCIANDELLQEDVYEFRYAKYADVGYNIDILDFVADYLNSGIGQPNMIVEDWMIDIIENPFFNKKTPYYTPAAYYLSKNKVFFCAKTGSTREVIWNIYNKVSGAWCTANVIMLIDSDLDNLIPEGNINNNIEADIIQGVGMFFVPIYDGQTHLVWIRNDYTEQVHMLRLFLEN